MPEIRTYPERRVSPIRFVPVDGEICMCPNADDVFGDVRDCAATTELLEACNVSFTSDPMRPPAP